MLKLRILAFVFIAASFAATAQENIFSYETPKKYFVKEITVSGLKFLDSGVITSVSGIAVGDSILVPGDVITNAVKKLWAQGLFSDVKISAQKIEGSDLFLDIFLQEQPRISSFNFKGVRKGEIDDLKDKLKLRAGGQLTESVLENSIIILKKHYRAKGFLNVEVDPIQENDTVIANGIRLTFDIKKNNKVKIGEIDFDGNTAYSNAKLRRALKKIHRRDINIFKPAKFIESDYEESQDNLITFYNEHGYRDSKILRDSIYKINDKRIGIKFFLYEGPQYHIRNINWIGNTKLPAEALTDILGMKKGDVYDKSLLEKRLFTDENSISTLYMDDGYLFFQLDPIESQIQNDSVDIEMRIYEGEQATINKVIIAGNTKTNEHVIRREVWSKPGYLFSKSEITRTLRELGQMGHFDPEKLDVKPMPNPADKTVDLKYILEEKANDQLEVSGGWGNRMFVGTVGIRFSNFSISRIFKKEAWRPIPSGDSQSLALRASTNGTYYKSFSLSFTEPWLGGKKPTNFSFSVYHQIQSGSTYFYQTSDKFFKVTGASIGIGTRLKWPDDYFTIFNEVSIQNYYLKKWEGYFIFSDGQSNNLSFKTTVSRNSTDQMIYPRRGSNISFSLQITPPYSSFNGKDYKSAMSDNEKYKWIEYHKWTGRIQWYMPLVENLVLYTNFQFGIMGYFNKDLGHSPFEGFDVGGDGMSGYNGVFGRETIGLRGYNNGSLTPYTTIGNSSIGDGHLYDKYSIELRYPLSLKPQAAIYLLTFLEAGNSWRNADEFNPFNVHRSAGVGARMFLPMLGMLGVDWGYGFDKITGKPNAHKGQFHFLIGMPF